MHLKSDGLLRVENLQKILFGAALIWLLIKEPEGLARLVGRPLARARARSC